MNRGVKVPSASALLPGVAIEPFEAREQEVEMMRSTNAERVKRTLQTTAAAARDRGLTQEKLAELLREDS